MKRYLPILLGTFSVFCENLEKSQKEGEEFGKIQSEQILFQLKELSPENFFPKVEKFESDQALLSVEKGLFPNTEARQFIEDETRLKKRGENKQFHLEEYFFQNADEIAASPLSPLEARTVGGEDQSVYSIETCVDAGDPFTPTLTRSLVVSVEHTPEKKKITKICTGHPVYETFFWKKDAKKEKDKLDEKLKKDSNIKSYTLDIGDGSAFKPYSVVGGYYHLDANKDCKSYGTHTHREKEEWEEKGETWVYDNLELMKFVRGPKCTLISNRCLDDTREKIINGLSVKRECWKQALAFFCQSLKKGNCELIRSKNCSFIQRECIEQTPYGCAQWKNTFKCLLKKDTNTEYLESNTGIYCLDKKCYKTIYDTNESFGEVATKLAVFSEMKKDLESSGSPDATRVRVFNGKNNKCSKNVLDNVLYDCCFTHSGIATKLGLAHCTDDEVQLGKKNEEGLCHYVGAYSEKFFDVLWKSRDMHTYCCFPSKLARVLQEEGRKQLGIDWGTPKEPNCQGLTTEEISKLNFSSLDLKEVYQDFTSKASTINIEDKLASFETRLESIQKRMNSVEGEK